MCKWAKRNSLIVCGSRQWVRVVDARKNPEPFSGGLVFLAGHQDGDFTAVVQLHHQRFAVSDHEGLSPTH